MPSLTGSELHIGIITVFSIRHSEIAVVAEASFPKFEKAGSMTGEGKRT